MLRSGGYLFAPFKYTKAVYNLGSGTYTAAAGVSVNGVVPTPLEYQVIPFITKVIGGSGN